MKKQVAILVDAEWFRKVLGSTLFPRASTTGITPAIPRTPITAEQFYRNACKALDVADEELFVFSAMIANHSINRSETRWTFRGFVLAKVTRFTRNA